MAKKLGLASVAGGVETQMDRELLHELDCHLAQGFFIAKPLSGDEFTNWAIAIRRTPVSQNCDNRVRRAFLRTNYGIQHKDISSPDFDS